MRDRREKLEQLRAEGVDPYSRGFQPTHTTEAAKALLRDAERTESLSLPAPLAVKPLQGGACWPDRLQACRWGLEGGTPVHFLRTTTRWTAPSICASHSSCI